MRSSGGIFVRRSDPSSVAAAEAAKRRACARDRVEIASRPGPATTAGFAPTAYARAQMDTGARRRATARIEARRLKATAVCRLARPKKAVAKSDETAAMAARG